MLMLDAVTVTVTSTISSTVTASSTSGGGLYDYGFSLPYILFLLGFAILALFLLWPKHQSVTSGISKSMKRHLNEKMPLEVAN